MLSSESLAVCSAISMLMRSSALKAEAASSSWDLRALALFMAWEGRQEEDSARQETAQPPESLSWSLGWTRRVVELSERLHFSLLMLSKCKIGAFLLWLSGLRTQRCPCEDAGSINPWLAGWLRIRCGHKLQRRLQTQLGSGAAVAVCRLQLQLQ